MSAQMVDMVLSSLEVPSSRDPRVQDVVPTAKRAFRTAQDVSDILSQSVSGKRFRGDTLLAPFRSVLSDQLNRGLQVINTGFSTLDAQTDETITQLVFAKPYPAGWEQNFVENSSLFCNRQDPEYTKMNNCLFSVADVPVLNYLLELKTLLRGNNFVQMGNVKSELERTTQHMDYMMCDTAEEFGEKWNLLGPMTTFKDGGIHSSFSQVRRAQGAQRQLGFCIYGRAHTFNLFTPSISRGQQLYYICTEIDISHLKTVVDPLGNSMCLRQKYPARALQITGFSDKDMQFVPHQSTCYDGDFDQPLKNPEEGDLDYMSRISSAAKGYKRLDYDEKTDEFIWLGKNSSTSLAEEIDAVPELVYEAYQEGVVKKLGVARYLFGRAPTEHQIQEGLRSQEKMKQLQQIELYTGL